MGGNRHYKGGNRSLWEEICLKQTSASDEREGCGWVGDGGCVRQRGWVSLRGGQRGIWFVGDREKASQGKSMSEKIE